MTIAVLPPLGFGRGGFRLTPLFAALVAGELALTGLLVSAPPGTGLAAIGLMVGMALIAALLLRLPAAEHEPLFVLLGVGFLIRVVALFSVHYAAISPGNPHGFLVPDSFGYDRVGWHLAQHWREGTSTRLGYQTAGFTIGYHYAVAGIYAVAGHAPLLVKALNVVLSASLVPLTFLLGRELAGRRAGLLAAFLIAIWPPIILWSVQIMKDILITLLLVLATWGWIVFARRPRLQSFAAALMPAFPLLFLRSYVFFFWTFGIAVGLALMALDRRRVGLALALLLGLGAAAWWTVVEFSPAWMAGLDLRIVKLDLAGSVAGSLFETVRLRTLGDILGFLPFGFTRFLLAPLPWKVDFFQVQWPEAVGSVLRYLLLPFAALGLFELMRSKRLAMAPIAVSGLLTILLYAVAFRGGVPRHMTQFYPVFTVFAAAGLPRWPHWPLPLALAWGTFLVVALALTWG